MLEEYPDVISVEELCKLLRIGRTRAYELLRSGELKGFQLGRSWRVTKLAVEEYLKKKS